MEDNSIKNSGTADTDSLRAAASQTGISGKAMLEGNGNINNTGGVESVAGSSESGNGNNAMVGTSGGNERTNGDLSGGTGGGTGISVPGDDNTRMGTSGAVDTDSTQNKG